MTMKIHVMAPDGASAILWTYTYELFTWPIIKCDYICTYVLERHSIDENGKKNEKA